MRLFYTLLLITGSCWAELPLATQVGIGYRQDSLNWNIASPTGHPNVLSELSWKNLQMVNIHGQMTYNCKERIYWRFVGDYGRIYHGTVRDSDWDGDDRTQEFSRSISDAGKGEAFDLSVGIGYKRFYLTKCITIIPLAGYAHQEQHLRMFDGRQIIDTKNNDLGPIEGLHSNYRAKWHSPWIGFDLYSTSCHKVELYGSFQGHYCRYRGSGHWNLRDDILNDFTHKGWGWGVAAKIGADYQILSCFSLGLLGEYQTQWTQKGWDRIRTTEDSKVITVRQPLNRVRWHSARVLFTMTYNP